MANHQRCQRICVSQGNGCNSMKRKDVCRFEFYGRKNDTTLCVQVYHLPDSTVSTFHYAAVQAIGEELPDPTPQVNGSDSAK